MEHQITILIILAPLIGALLVTLLWWVKAQLCFPTAVLASSTSLICSLLLLTRVLEEHTVTYWLGGWRPPYGIAFQADRLNSLIIVAVAFVSLLNLIGSRTLARQEFEGKAGAFYALYLLFITGLFGILMTGDAFNLYVLLEIASLTGYALIGMGSGRAPLSGLNYLLMGTVGASLYLLGIGYLYLMTGTLNMADLAGLLPPLYSSRVILLAFILCLVGLFVKMALFPLHGWLPNAYGYSPSLVASLVAPLTTKVMIYAMIRITLSIFGFDFSFNLAAVQQPIVVLASLGIVVSSLMALAQKRLKKMLAYIVVAEVGYMVGGFWLGNRLGMNGAILHLINDALMTLCVFLAAGVLLHRVADDRFANFKGVFASMPVSMAAMVVGGLSLIGIPPTCGFFSKWYLISGGLAAGQFGFVAALIGSSLINIVLFFRFFEIGFFEQAKPVSPALANLTASKNSAEAPLDALVPLLATAILLIVLGLYSGRIVTRIIDPALPATLI